MGILGYAGYLMRRGALGALVAAVALAAASVPAQAGEHVFNPKLSLTGDCGTSSLDNVADPGVCPIPPGTVFEQGSPGADHPSEAFSNPSSVTTDSHGDIYVASHASAETGEGGRVDVFDSKGFFITELPVTGPEAVAVDSKGNLYVVVTLTSMVEIFRYSPSKYEPATGEIEYGEPPVAVGEPSAAAYVALALDPLNDRLFANFGGTEASPGGKPGELISEFGSAEEGNVFIESIGVGIGFGAGGFGLAIDAADNRIYATDILGGSPLVQAFELEAPHAQLGTFDGSTTPEGPFGGHPSLAVDESDGHLFVFDTGEGGEEVVYEFEVEKDGEGNLHEQYLATIDHALKGHNVYGAQIAVDNGASSPNGAKSTFGRYLFVPAYPTPTGHLFAFGPPEPTEPEVESVSFSGVTETEALLEAKVNPNFLETDYAIEYLPAKQFEEQGETFAGAQLAVKGKIPAGGAPVEVSAALEGLAPATAYRFRVVAENEKGPDEAQGEFATYPEETAPVEPCPNEAFRSGHSALLPDCRAYELVTPSRTNGRPPGGVNRLGVFFPTRQASPVGDAVSFQIEGGIIPGYEATGSWAGDPYVAHRTETGWSTEYTGGDPAESPDSQPGGFSPDQGYSFWSTAGGGSASIGGKATPYLRYPDGHSALIGRGSLGVDPFAHGMLISAGGEHVIFQTGVDGPAVRLEEDAPPAGTEAVYDRRVDPAAGPEETRVVSLLPGNSTLAAGENAEYEGASLDGEGIAFRIGKKLYLRYRDEATYEIAEEAAFAGISEGGGRIFYLKGGNLFAYDVAKAKTVQFTNSGNATPVNVSGQGHVAYFVSPSVLVGEANPNGAKAKAGQENLYRSKDGVIAFLGTLTTRDVEGEKTAGTETVDGLGLWMQAAAGGHFGADSSRATPDGNVLVFESRAKLSAYDPEGHAEAYRYDFAAKELTCLSCNPTLAPASGEASLQSLKLSSGDTEPFTSFALVENLRADGRRVFFQTTEALAPTDVDRLGDVYEWEAEGVGSCVEEGGCLFLISSGHSRRVDDLYAVGESGDDVFIRTGDQLLGADGEETASIYDARVGGGFPEPAEEVPCQGESCKPGITPAPALGTPAEPVLGAEDNVSPPKHCPNGTRKVAREGKERCVKKHHRKRRHKKRKGAGK